METREYVPELDGQPTPGSNQSGARAGNSITLSLRSLRLYQTADALSGGLIYLMVVFSPWAFGTTQRWSVWVMNVCGYLLGCLLLIKLYVRFRHGYQPSRWGEPSANKDSTTGKYTCGRFLVVALAVLTALILGYCLVSALNARATYQRAQWSFVYHECIQWLPHSYDSNSTWRAFWNYLALAFSFWALRDWLLGRSAGETRARNRADGRDFLSLLPQRLRWLLWLLSLNGVLLGVEGICQRVSGTNKLLWLMPTRLNQAAIYQFGPYAYRSNGAQYLNLVWPATLGLWWVLHRAARRRPKPSVRSSGWRHHLLLPCVLVMAACPIISTSRGGAIVAVTMIVAAALILLFAMRRHHPLTRFAMVSFLGAAFALGAYMGGDQLMERMGQFGTNLSGREASYDTARSMARDYPLFGVGPGAFDPMFQLYRTSFTEYWPAQLHNDWLETRITFGWAGSFLIGLAFLAVLTRVFAPGGIAGGWQFVLLLWLALAGCLIHARFDFPLQIYSILFLFLLLCAILSALSLRVRASD
jgi:O-antigen ligase